MQPVMAAVRSYGADLGAHRSGQLDEELISGADLVLCVGVEHAPEGDRDAPRRSQPHLYPEGAGKSGPSGGSSAR